MLEMTDEKLVIIKASCIIPELGGISGPVTTPTSLPVKKILQLINGHKLVYEVNPANYKETVKLTIRNVREVNFKKPVVKTEPVKVEKKVEEKPKTPEIKVDVPKGDFEKK